MKKGTSKVSIGKRQIELSNLQKVLFPESHIIKAELIEYYLKVAPTILRHIKGRPLSLVRFPDGVTGESFFQKNLPDWTPSWIQKIAMGETDIIEYAVATEDATLVWLANLACIELHQIHARQPDLKHPDYVVWDIDPPPGFPFVDVVDIAFSLREHIEGYGYHTFVKTTGGKGVHIVSPLEPLWEFDAVRDAAYAAAKDFIENKSTNTTLQIKKEARRGKVLIDVYRNRPYQTIISPYSVRGFEGAPVSMPLTWERLEAVTDPREYNLTNAPAVLNSDGDAWEAIGAYAGKLHSAREKQTTRVAAVEAKDSESVPGSGKGGGSESHGSESGSQKPDGGAIPPESLTDYARKRSFDRTPEPGPAPGTSKGHEFVVHRHHATRLHYDLRLEQNGTLRSWAVPKGLPPRPGIKRLAVAVEDHPMSYISFEAEIPKGQYGGGMMWIYARGKWDLTKQKKEGFYFRLNSREVNAEYRLINTRDKEWLLERIDQPQVDWLRTSVQPMLAEVRDKPFDSEDYIYEVKWDGIRALISLDEEELTIRSRNGRVITKQFPELNIPVQALRATSALLDAEIVCLDEKGKPIFQNVIRRLQQTTDSGIARLREKLPATCYLFDVLYLDGRPVIAEPLERRRDWLQDLIREQQVYRLSEAFPEGKSLYDAASAMELEGIVAKLKTSPYTPGKRSPSWLKVKTHRSQDCIIIGYTRGKGDRENAFGALQLACYKRGELAYVGKVGTGFDSRRMAETMDILKELKTGERPVETRPLDDAQTVWLEPSLVCEVRYSSITLDEQLREPVFIRMRPDKTPDECVLEVNGS
jgi:DNA ligase D-like protein (predicted ligase)/DNA ligase D-like protein (predicted polymerase)/DNA ligase D-like protein (predicted 3'-phosphoesterase)